MGDFLFVAMTSSFVSSRLSTSVVAGINHLLVQEPWARDKLAAHAGKSACFDAEIAAFTMAVAADGMLESATENSAPDVTIRIKAADLLLIAQNRERAFSYVKIEGDADFANTISQMSQSLRWEAEADLAKIFGDITAVRMVSTAKAVFETAKSTQTKVAENVAEFLLEEKPMLVRPQAVADFASDVVKLRDDVERLGKRVEKLVAKCS